MTRKQLYPWSTSNCKPTNPSYQLYWVFLYIQSNALWHFDKNTVLNDFFDNSYSTYNIEYNKNITSDILFREGIFKMFHNKEKRVITHSKRSHCSYPEIYKLFLVAMIRHFEKFSLSQLISVLWFDFFAVFPETNLISLFNLLHWMKCNPNYDILHMWPSWWLTFGYYKRVSVSIWLEGSAYTCISFPFDVAWRKIYAT